MHAGAVWAFWLRLGKTGSTVYDKKLVGLEVQSFQHKAAQ